MQPRNLPVVDPLAAPDAPAELAALDAGAAGALLAVLLLRLDELLPHAAISRVAAPAAATVATNEVCLTVFPFTGPDADAQVWQGRSLGQIARRLFRHHVLREEACPSPVTSLRNRDQNDQ
jgi:hypothetical protein